MTPTITVQRDDFDPGEVLADLGRSSGGAGALASFVGLCRDEGGRLAALELEHYPDMAASELGRLAQEAGERWPLLGFTIIHRFGLIRPGERIVMVAAASGHRKAALAAVDYAMDILKTTAPFWKREHPAGQTPGAWVEARPEDDHAAAAWAVSDRT